MTTTSKKNLEFALDFRFSQVQMAMMLVCILMIKHDHLMPIKILLEFQIKGNLSGTMEALSNN